MAKRRSGSDDDSPHRKRQKITKQSLPQLEVIEIQTPKDLQLLLAFEQDAGPHVRQSKDPKVSSENVQTNLIEGVQSFKLFLDSIAYGKESDERSARRVILLEYLRSQTPNESEDACTNLADLVRTWHFATQANVESLFSSVVAVLALLLKTISTLIEFRDCGNHLCRSLLQDDQMNLFDRGLSANKAKEHLISPCLRLLTEIVSFDGGHSARTVFRQREVAFKRLEVFLGMRKGLSGEEAGSRKRPSIRNNALRYLYANLRLQAPTAKMYILAQGKAVRAVFENISEDSPTVILELLEVLKKDVASDIALPHAVKGRFFNEWALSRLGTLYRYTEADAAAEGHVSVQQMIHEFLLFLCTSPGHGVLDIQAQRNIGIEDGRHGHCSEVEPGFKNSFRKNNKPTGKNTSLALFLQGLRPYASILQSELILAVFHTAPEMMSDYFARKKSFSFDPRATATWIGYSSFLIATVRLPLPRAFTVSNANDRASTSYNRVIDSIMPEPMTQSIMTRCLNQSTDLIKFMSTKLLIAAFEKLAEVLRTYRGRHDHTDQKRDSSSWSQAALDITAEFCCRIPDIDHVIAQLRGCSSGNVVLRESLTRLLALYYVVISQVALEAKFDVSIALSAVLHDDDPDVGSQKKDGVPILELDHILEIAERSPNMQWWHKSGAKAFSLWVPQLMKMIEKMGLSPLTTLLKLHVNRRQAHFGSRQLGTLLASVFQDSHLLDSVNCMLSLDVLVLTLQNSDKWKASHTVFEFLDNCILRLVRKPVHYYDAFSNLVTNLDGAVKTTDTHVDLLLIAIMEQWPFLVKVADLSTVTNVATWLVRYLEFSWLRLRDMYEARLHRESTEVLTQIRDQIKVAINDKACHSMLERTLSDPRELGLSIEWAIFTGTNKQKRDEKPISQDEAHQPEPRVNQIPPGPPEEHEDHPGLNRWTREDNMDAINDGAIEELLLCLCSKYGEIRQQAMTSVGTFMAKLEVRRSAQILPQWLTLFRHQGTVSGSRLT